MFIGSVNSTNRKRNTSIFLNLSRIHWLRSKTCVYIIKPVQIHLTQRRLITLPTPTGRVTLTSEKFLAKDGRQIKLETIENEEAFYAKLEEVFGYSTQIYWLN